MTNCFADTPQYENIKKILLPTATNSDLEMIKYAKIALKNIYLPGFKYKKTGVIMMDIAPDGNRQLNLLHTTDHAKENTLMHFLDDLTARYVRDTVRVAAQGTKKKKDGNLNREFLSPCYTTRIQEDVKAYRIGQIRIDVYLIGWASNGVLCGLKTFQVKT